LSGKTMSSMKQGDATQKVGEAPNDISMEVDNAAHKSTIKTNNIVMEEEDATPHDVLEPKDVSRWRLQISR
jgi:hypothetical protein